MCPDTTFAYNFASGWGISAVLRVVKRDNEHVDTASGETEKWQFTGLGDVRLAGRCQFPDATPSPASTHAKNSTAPVFRS